MNSGSIPASCVLDCTVELFQRDKTSSYKAVLFALIQRERYFVADGFKTMKAFAEKRLDVRSSGAFDKLSAAGKTALDVFPEESEQIVGLLSMGELPFSNAYPANFPGTSTLSALGRFLKVLPARRDEVITRVRSGEWGEAELNDALAASRSLKPVKPRAPLRGGLTRAIRSIDEVGNIVDALDESERRTLCDRLKQLLSKIQPEPLLDGGESTHTPVWVEPSLGVPVKGADGSIEPGPVEPSLSSVAPTKASPLVVTDEDLTPNEREAKRLFMEDHPNLLESLRFLGKGADASADDQPAPAK